MHRSRGFTLVELLVVIAIIGILVALLLPAVQMAREAARATQCKNNIKQIGLALHTFHDVNNTLPPGWLSAGSPTGPTGWGWATNVLSQIEQQNLRDRLRLDLPISDAANKASREAVIPTFICSSDPLDAVFGIHGSGSADEFANVDQSGTVLFPISKANYAGVYGVTDIEIAPSAGQGVFYHNSKTRFAAVTDGLSNTFFIGERSSRRGGTIWAGMIPEANSTMARIVGTADHTPNHPAHHFDDFSSYHPTGAHFLVGDGSVRRLNDQIDFLTYQSLMTRSGGEAASADQ